MSSLLIQLGCCFQPWVAVCRSLFEKDKLLFAFGVAAGLQVDGGKMEPADLRFLLTGGVAVGELPAPNPCPAWLSDKSWGEVCRASKLPDPIWQVSTCILSAG